MSLILKYNKIIFSGLMVILFFLIAVPAVLAAGIEITTGLNETAEEGFGADITKSDTELPSLIGKIVGAGLALIGVIFFVIIVYAGISWIMAMGKEEKINEAKDMIVGAILGLIVVLSAYAITAMVAGIFAK